MRVCLYLEGEEQSLARRGIRTAFRTVFLHHRQALNLAGVAVTTDPHESYDILHLHTFGLRSLYHLRRAKRRGIKIVTHAHSVGSYDIRNSITLANQLGPVYERYLRFFYSQADYVFTPSKRAQELLQDGGLRQVAVVSNGIDRKQFTFSPRQREECRKEFNLTRFTIYCAGYVVPRKGVVDFINVAKRLPKFDFIWYGYKWPKLLIMSPRMHQKIKQQPPNVQFPGFIRNTQGAFSAADVLLFPTQGENQPLVILEAASLGRPLIVRDLPVFSGWLEHGVNCLKGNSVEEFVELVKRVAEDERLRAKLAQGAKDIAEEHQLERVGERLKGLYENVLGSEGT